MWMRMALITVQSIVLSKSYNKQSATIDVTMMAAYLTVLYGYLRCLTKHVSRYQKMERRLAAIEQQYPNVPLEISGTRKILRPHGIRFYVIELDQIQWFLEEDVFPIKSG